MTETARTHVSVHARAEWPAVLDVVRAQPMPRPSMHAIVEGLAPGALPEGLEVTAIAGCACCTGQLALRVTLARLMRCAPPERLFIVVGDARHVPTVRTALADAQWAARLVLLDP